MVHFSAGDLTSTLNFFILSRLGGSQARSVSPACVGMTVVVGMVGSPPPFGTEADVEAEEAAANDSFQSFSYDPETVREYRSEFRIYTF